MYQPCTTGTPVTCSRNQDADTSSLAQPGSGLVSGNRGGKAQQVMGQSRASYFREYRAKRAVRDAAGGLLPFQSAFRLSRL